MTENQTQRLRMYASTIEFLNQHTALWSATPIVSVYKQMVSLIIEGINDTVNLLDASKSYSAENIDELKTLIAEKMDVLDDMLEAYAEDIGNDQLLEEASNSKSDYFKLANNPFQEKVKKLIGLLENHAPNMKDYGLSQSMIDEVKHHFANFQEITNQPQLYRVSNTTQDLEDLFTESVLTLTRLDKVIGRYEEEEPAFFDGYQKAREIAS